MERVISALSIAVTWEAAAKELQESYLRLIAKASNIDHLYQIQTQTIVTNIRKSLPVITKLIQRIFDFGHRDHGRLLFSTIPNPDVFLFNVLLRSSDDDVSVYTKLLRHLPRLHPDSYSLSFAITAASNSRSFTSGRLLHGHTITLGYQTSPFVASTLMNFYLSFSQTSIAAKVFDGIPSPDTICFNTLISGLIRNSRSKEALNIFSRFFNGAFRLDYATIAGVLPIADDLEVGTVLHCLGLKSGLDRHAYVTTSLISMYSKVGSVSTAKYLFREINVPDLVTWNAIIGGCSNGGDVESSVAFFKELIGSGQHPNRTTFLCFLPGTGLIGYGELTRSIHGLTLKSGVNIDRSVSSALTTVYSRLNDMVSAREVFDNAPENCLITWNSMISGYVQNGYPGMAVDLFKKMRRVNSIRPNPTTMTSILSACAHLGKLNLGKWIHRTIISLELELGFESNVFVSTALIDMYAKCGKIEYSRRIFDTMAMEEKNVVSWNAMITAYGQHGCGRESLKLFSEMLDFGVTPTSVTFLSLLYACSHSGLVEDGERIFRLMQVDFDISPSSDHYTSMVDLFGRAGWVHQALEFIKTIPEMKLGAAVWGALLGACMLHGNSDLAKYASKKLFELDPDSSGHYVLLSNIHSAHNHYPEAASIRNATVMRKHSKSPGYSFFEENR